MDSRTGFSILLVIVGLVGVWLAFTGKLKQIIAAAQQPTQTAPSSSSTPGQPGAAGAAGGSWSSVSVTPQPPQTNAAATPSAPALQVAATFPIGNGLTQPLGLPATLLAYQQPIGNDGAALFPVTGTTYLGGAA